MQKLILGRALSRRERGDRTPPRSSSPTSRPGASTSAPSPTCTQQLLDARARGAAVLLISDDLDEIMALADRIARDARAAGSPRRGRRRAWTLRGDRPRDGGGSDARCGLRRARSSRARWLVAAPFAAVAFTLVVARAARRVGRRAGRAHLRAALRRRLRLALRVERDADARDAADPHRPRRAVAFRAQLFNIGAEGQLYAGALAAVAVGGLHGGTGFGAARRCCCSRDDRPRRCSPARCCCSARRCCKTRSASTRW